MVPVPPPTSPPELTLSPSIPRRKSVLVIITLALSAWVAGSLPAQAQGNSGNNNPNVGPGNNNGNGGNNGNNGNGNGNNGNGGGGGNVNPSSSPPTPYVTELIYLAADTTTEIEVFGQADPGEAFVASRGNEVISASFSHSGITVNSITVNSDTSLTLTITVASGAALEGATLTITNPNGDSATSSENVVAVTDIPEILAATVMPTPPSVIEDIEATVLALQDSGNGPEVSYEYEWYEDGVLMNDSGPVLPAASTRQGRSYHAVIKPVKNANSNRPLHGQPYPTPAAVVTADKDGNGIHDQWEKDLLGGLGADPDSDGDGDGIVNRTEYLFGLDPNQRDTSRGIVSPLDPHTGQFQYSRPLERLDPIRYRVMVSTDLVEWTEQTGLSQVLTRINAHSEVVTVELPSSLMQGKPKLFVKITAE